MQLKMDRCVVNSERSLWVFYQNSFVCEQVGESSQHLSMKVQSQLFPNPMVFSFVHVKFSDQERALLWAALLVDNPMDSPWFLMGDFNVIVNVKEKRCGFFFSNG